MSERPDSNHSLRRKSPRLQGYDYTLAGAYFVTICTHERTHLFGNIHNEEMHYSLLGDIAFQELQQLPNHWQNLDVDLFVVMPNHVHAIIILIDPVGKFQQPKIKLPTLGQVIGNYKAGVTCRARQQKILNGEIWQGRYHEHIIRNEVTLNRIREYVHYNPALWTKDTFYT